MFCNLLSNTTQAKRQRRLRCVFLLCTQKKTLFGLVIDKKIQACINALLNHPAGVVELVDTQVSDACGGNPVEVQVLSSAMKGSSSITSNGLRSIMMSFLSGPVEMRSIGTPANFSTYNRYFWALAGRSLKRLMLAVDSVQPGNSS